MSSLNKVMIIGRLGRDPELKYSQSGMAMCTLNVATDESYTDKSGQKVDRAAVLDLLERLRDYAAVTIN